MSDIKRLDIIPNKLKEARLARGFTITALAEKMNLYKQSISQYELDQAKPSFDTIQKYCDILNFPINYFLKDNFINLNEGTVFFRSLKSTEAVLREEIKILIQWANLIYTKIEKYIEFPILNMPTITEELLKDLDQEKIENIASLVRDYWGLGNQPIQNLALTLETNGIIICNNNINYQQIDACSQIINKNLVFFVRTNNISACRLRFDLAHELGHAILHRDITKEELEDKKVLDKIEKEANMFAGAFLLPKDSFGNDVMAISLEHLINLKAKWKVSISAIIYRCSTLGIFNENQVLYLRKMLGVKNWRKVEPLDDSIRNEKPSLIANAIKIIINEKVSTKTILKNDINLPEEDIEELSSLPNGYLGEDVVPLKVKNNVLNFYEFNNKE